MWWSPGYLGIREGATLYYSNTVCEAYCYVVNTISLEILAKLILAKKMFPQYLNILADPIGEFSENKIVERISRLTVYCDATI